MSCDCNTLVVGEAGPQGPQGLSGTNGTNGTNGVNAFTTVAVSTFVQPSVLGSVTFNVGSNQWIGIGQPIYISNTGFYEVDSLSGTTQVTATLLSTDGVSPGGTVAIGTKISPSAVATYSAPLSTLTVSGTSIFSNGPVNINTSGATANDVTIGGATDSSLFVVDASTNRIGIGLPAPAAKLHVSGTFQVGTGPFGSDSEFTKGAVFNSLQGSVSFAASDVTIKTQNVIDTFVVDASADRVGIGTNAPSRLLDVDGTGQAKAWIVNPGGTALIDSSQYVFRVLGSGSVSSIVSDATNNFVGIRTNPTAPLDVSGSAKISGDVTVATSALVVQTSGAYVGVNVTSPTTNLHVVGSGLFSGNLTVQSSAAVSGNFSVGGIFVGASSCSVSSLTVANATTLSTLVATSTVNVNNGVLYVDTSNNRVGVNTITPSSPFSVVGNADFSDQLYITNDLFVATDVFVVDGATNRIGVNISSPTVALDISGDVKISGVLSVSTIAASTITSPNPTFDKLTVAGSAQFDTDVFVVNATTNKVGVNISSPAATLDVVGSGKISENLIVGTSALVVDSTNNFVGVNLTTPAVSLDVSGTVNVNGALQRNAPVSKTADFSVGDAENWIIVDKGSTAVVTLPTASSWTGREIMIKTIQNQAVDASATVVVSITGSVGVSGILSATAGKWATLVSDGSYWQIMAEG